MWYRLFPYWGALVSSHLAAIGSHSSLDRSHSGRTRNYNHSMGADLKFVIMMTVATKGVHFCILRHLLFSSDSTQRGHLHRGSQLFQRVSRLWNDCNRYLRRSPSQNQILPDTCHHCCRVHEGEPQCHRRSLLFTWERRAARRATHFCCSNIHFQGTTCLYLYSLNTVGLLQWLAEE